MDKPNINIKMTNEVCYCIKQNIPSQVSPIESFEEIKLNRGLRKGMHLLGLQTPNKVQKCTVPLFLHDCKSSCVLFAPRRSGKTVTVLITALEELTRGKRIMSPRIVMLCPTYELAKKTYEVALELAKYISDITLRLVTRGKDIKRNKRITDDMVIGTPEKVCEVYGYDSLDLQKVETLIMDEVDSMVPTAINHSNNVIRICCQLPRPRNSRFILCSCTKSKNVSHFIDRYVHFPGVVEFPIQAQQVRQIFLLCRDMEQKLKAMFKFVTTYKYPGQSVVICNKKETAIEIVKMYEQDWPVILLAGKKKSKERDNIIKTFNEGNIEMLITTPGFTKIISSSDVSKIFNFDQILTEDFQLNREAYTERASLIVEEKQGIVVNVVDREWAPSILPEGTYDQFGQEIIAFENMF